MGIAVFDDVTPFLGQNVNAAVVMCRTEHDNLHAGLLYRNGAGKAFLHLGWEDSLSDKWGWRCLWAAPNVDPARLNSIAMLCRRILKRFAETNVFPYGLIYAGTSFDDSGRLQLGPGARGLTCATFVLAIFKYCGLHLIDEDSWPVRRDKNEEFIDAVRRFANAEHLSQLLDEIASGCRRICPDEVLGACAHAPPVSFDDARREADNIVTRTWPSSRQTTGQDGDLAEVEMPEAHSLGAREQRPRESSSPD